MLLIILWLEAVSIVHLRVIETLYYILLHNKVYLSHHIKQLVVYQFVERWVKTYNSLLNTWYYSPLARIPYFVWAFRKSFVNHKTKTKHIDANNCSMQAYWPLHVDNEISAKEGVCKINTVHNTIYTLICLWWQYCAINVQSSFAWKYDVLVPQ